MVQQNTRKAISELTASVSTLYAVQDSHMYALWRTRRRTHDRVGALTVAQLPAFNMCEQQNDPPTKSGCLGHALRCSDTASNHALRIATGVQHCGPEVRLGSELFWTLAHRILVTACHN